MKLKEIISEFETYTLKEICGKLIVIFDSHNMALPIWGAYSNEINEACQLITFDSHSDTLPVFNAYLCQYDDTTKKIRRKCLTYKKNYKQGSFYFDDVFSLSYQYVRNDEQIKAAYDFGYINRYVVITNDASRESNQREDVSEKYDCIYISKDDWTKKITIEKKPFILDFDLDFFTAHDDLPNDNCILLKNLILNSGIITIAREPEYFKKCKLNKSDKTFTNELVLKSLERFIKEALS